MNKSIYYNGSDYEELKRAFLEYFDEKYLLEIFEIMDNTKDDFLDDEEIFEIRSEKGSSLYQGYNKLISRTHYHVNIKNISIICLQIFGEIILQANIKGNDISKQEIPVIPSIIELKKCFNKLCEENGEFCVCKEIKCKRGNFSGWGDFTNSRKECINNYIECSFNYDGNCELSKEEFEAILKVLIQKNIVVKSNGGYKIVL